MEWTSLSFHLLAYKMGTGRVPTWKDLEWVQRHVRTLPEGSEHPTRGSRLHHLFLILTKFPPPPQLLSSSYFHWHILFNNPDLCWAQSSGEMPRATEHLRCPAKPPRHSWERLHMESYFGSSFVCSALVVQITGLCLTLQDWPKLTCNAISESQAAFDKPAAFGWSIPHKVNQGGCGLNKMCHKTSPGN